MLVLRLDLSFCDPTFTSLELIDTMEDVLVNLICEAQQNFTT